MSMTYLGETIDIHTGGVDHIPLHHENEIAQSEGATGKLFVRFWFHNNFLMVDNQKMSKSLNNFYTLDDLKKHKIEPLAIRYLFLQSHYRQLMNFTWESATSAQEGLNKLKNIVLDLKKEKTSAKNSAENYFTKRFNDALSNDLQTSQAVAVMWEMLKTNLSSKQKLEQLFEFDKVFGLNLEKTSEEKIPREIIQLVEERKIARQNKDFKKSDELRKKIKSLGYSIEDIKNNNYKIKRN